jgi:hypothetical protein
VPVISCALAGTERVKRQSSGKSASPLAMSRMNILRVTPVTNFKS